jgi:ComF family protein
MPVNINYLKKMTAWLLPYTCLLCRSTTDTERDLCIDCQHSLPLLKNGCLACARPLPSTSHATHCQLCVQHPPPFDVTHALFLYEQPITQLILELKFKQSLANARILGELLAQQIRQHWYAQKTLPDVIIPIPLHAARIKQRGFNQAHEIARPIATAIQRPIKYHGVHRVKSTRAQATLNVIDREKNIQDAFAINLDLSQQHIAVIDDVITTGETIKEFCKMLRQAGAQKIDVWCCARAQQLSKP